MRSVDFLTPIRRRSRLNKGLLRWWRAEPKRNASPRLRDLTSKSPMTLSGALRLGQRGLTGADGASVFDGTDDYGQTAAIDLSGITTMTVAMWLYWDAFDNANDLALESSATSATNIGAIYFNPNSATTRFQVRVRTSGAAHSSYSFTRPSAAAWHHYVACFDRGGTTQQVTAVYVDGVAQSLTADDTTLGDTGGFGNYAWNFMSRNATSLFAAGRLDDVRIYNRVLPAWEARALMHASRRGYPQELRWSRGAEFGGYEAAVVPPSGGALASLCDWDWGNNMSVDTYHNAIHGALEAIGSTALPLSASTRKLHKGVTILANSSNAQTVWIGTSAVTPGTVAATDGLPLTAGQSVAIPIDMLSRVYVVAASGSNKVHYWGS